MACLGDGVARSFAQLGNLDAYQLDLVGGLLGVIAFAVLVVRLRRAGGVGSDHGGRAAGGHPAAAPCRSWPSSSFRSWRSSPPSASSRRRRTRRGRRTTRCTRGRSATPAASSPRSTGSRRGCSSGRSATRCTRRCTSASRPSSPGDVLIIGAGSGNDVAVALARGATSVDAVEIDESPARRRPDASRPPLRRPSRRHARRRRPSVPRGDRSALGHDPARPAGLADAAPGPVVGAPGELPVHRRGGRVVPSTPHRRRHVRDVQLLPRAVARRSVRGDARRRVRPSPVREHRRRARVLSVLVVSADPAFVRVPARTRRSTRVAVAPAPATDDHPFPYLRTPSIPGFYVARHRLHPRTVARRRSRRRRTAANR